MRHITENYNVEDMSTEPMPESEDTSTAANHSFPGNTSRNSETRRKRKSGENRHFLSCWHWKKKIEQLEKAVQQKSIISTQEDEDYRFLMGLLPHHRDIPKRRKLAVRLASLQVLIEEGSEESARTEWSSGSSNYSNSTVPTPSPSYGMQSSESEHTLHTTYSTTQLSQRYQKLQSTFMQLAELDGEYVHNS